MKIKLDIYVLNDHTLQSLKIDARVMEKIYNKMTEDCMLTFYNNLSEKDRRHYAAIEAEKLGHGGITYISDLFGCSRQTVHDGIEELKKKH